MYVEGKCARDVTRKEEAVVKAIAPSKGQAADPAAPGYRPTVHSGGSAAGWRSDPVGSRPLVSGPSARGSSTRKRESECETVTRSEDVACTDCVIILENSIPPPGSDSSYSGEFHGASWNAQAWFARLNPT